MFLLMGMSILLGTIYYHRNYLCNKLKRFNNLTNEIVNQYPNDYYLYSLYKSLCIVTKRNYNDLYNHFTVVRINKFLFIKYINGGNVHTSICLIQSGPKKMLEYGYIDDQREDELFNILLGVNKDFSGHPEALLELGQQIRYKFYQEDEIILSGGAKNKNIEKIKKLV